MVRTWIDNKKLNAFQSPGGESGKYYVKRVDFDKFLQEVPDFPPGDEMPAGFIAGVVNAKSPPGVLESPKIFMGTLSTLQTNLTDLAKSRRVNIEKRAEMLSFQKFLGRDEPPEEEGEELIPLIKQRSAVRDIMFLLLNSKVYEITDIRKSSNPDEDKATGGSYSTMEFEVTFIATYPKIATFIESILMPDTIAQTGPDPKKVEQLPKNMFVIRDITYESEEKQLEKQLQEEYQRSLRDEETRARAAESATTPSASTVYDPYRSGMYGGMTPLVTAPRRTTTRTTGMEDYREIENAMTRYADQKLPGRRPRYNLLKVTMKIVFVDLSGEITGEESKGQTTGGMMGRY